MKTNTNTNTNTSPIAERFIQKVMDHQPPDLWAASNGHVGIITNNRKHAEQWTKKKDPRLEAPWKVGLDLEPIEEGFPRLKTLMEKNLEELSIIPTVETIDFLECCNKLESSYIKISSLGLECINRSNITLTLKKEIVCTRPLGINSRYLLNVAKQCKSTKKLVIEYAHSSNVFIHSHLNIYAIATIALRKD